MQYRLKVYGKLRIIKDVRVSDGENFEAYYRGYRIHCWIDEKSRSYAQCFHPDGETIVDGYLGGGLLHKAVQGCVRNILL